MTPTRAEIIRAKTLIVDCLGVRASVRYGDLVEVLNDEAGIPRMAAEDEHIRLPSEHDPGWEPDRDAPVVARQRNLRAARIAIDELARRGAVAASKPGKAAIPVRRRNGAGTYDFGFDEPGNVADRYAASGLWDTFGLGDVDLFTVDLGVLGLDQRTRRCLEEALAAYRHGLYLAAVNLLGAVSEGAWYAAGKRLREHDTQLAKALDSDQTAKVIKRVCELMRRVGRLKATADELHACAAYLRDLRNYGVHPRETIDTRREPVFTDAATLCLILQTHRYLVRLADAVAILTATEGSGD